MLAFENNDPFGSFLTSEVRIEDKSAWGWQGRVNVVFCHVFFWILAGYKCLSGVSPSRYEQPWIVKIHKGPEQMNTNDIIYKTHFFSGFVANPQWKYVFFCHFSSLIYPSPNHDSTFFSNKATTESPLQPLFEVIFEGHTCRALRSLRICILHGEASEILTKMLQSTPCFTEDVSWFPLKPRRWRLSSRDRQSTVAIRYDRGMLARLLLHEKSDSDLCTQLSLMMKIKWSTFDNRLVHAKVTNI